MIPDQTKATLSQGLEIFRRRKWPALLIFLGTFTVMSSMIVFLPDVYESKATLLVESQQVPESYIRSTVTSGVDTRLQGITEALMSRDRLADLIERFDLYPDLREEVPLEEVVARMRRDVKMQFQGVTRQGKKTSVSAFTLSYRGNDPQKVAAVTNEISAFYIEEDLRVRERQASGTADFLESQLEQWKQKLDEQERRVKDFKERYLGELPQQQGANLSTLERLNAQLVANQERQIRAREEKSVLEKQVAEAGLSASSAPDAIAARLAQARAELFQLRKRFTDKYPDVVYVKNEIAELEKRLAEIESGQVPEEELFPQTAPAVATTTSISREAAAIRALEAEIRGLAREESAFKQRIAEYQERVENAPRREQEFIALQRDYDTTQKTYETLLKRHQEAKLAENLENRQKGEQFRILDRALPAQTPTAPNRPRLFVIGLVLSIVGAIGAIVASEVFDTSFHSVDDLREFSRLPVVAVIQRVVTEKDRRRARWRFRLGAVSAVAGAVLLVFASWIIARENTWLAGLLS